MNCAACVFFRLDPEKSQDGCGECRRFPPVPVFNPNLDSTESNFPLSMHDDWCGEYRPKGQTD